MDRRRGERRHPNAGDPTVERRTAPRRKASESPTSLPGSLFRLAHQLDECDVYEAMSPESASCPHCSVVVSLEMPRFAEPPVRLDLILHHDASADGVRHVRELQSLSATGRVLLSTRIVGRASSRPPSRAARNDTLRHQDAGDSPFHAQDGRAGGGNPGRVGERERQARAGRWTTASRADVERLRALASDLRVPLREEGLVPGRRGPPFLALRRRRRIGRGG
jgi:hypothetical protein